MRILLLILLVLVVLFGQTTTMIEGTMCNQKAFSFGWDQHGQLGQNATSTDHNIPVAVNASGVLDGLNLTAVCGGRYHSLVLAENGKVFSFGYNTDGELGDGSNTASNIPVSVSATGVLNGKTIIAIAGGGWYSLVLSSTGKVFSFGDNTNGQLGDGTTTTSSNIPVAVSTSGVLNGKTITAIAAGEVHSLVLSDSGQVFSFGRNNYGQLGDDTNTKSSIPVSVDTSGFLSGKTITAISAGWYHSLVLASDGRVFSFGYNEYGQLGEGSTNNKNTPATVLTDGVLNGQTIIAISAGAAHSLVLSTSGQVFSFGNNGDGQLGSGTTTDSNTPITVNASGVLSGVQITAIAAGGYHSLACSANGQLFSWGSNDYGQLGDGTTTQRNLPVFVSPQNEPAGFGVPHIGAGEGHSMVLIATLKNVAGGTVRDGATPGQEILFQSNTDKVSANWDAFVASSWDGQARIMKAYNITTIEVETGQAVVGPRLIEFESESQVFFIEQTPSVSLKHNKTYSTQINTPTCNSESMASIGFRIDTTAPEIGSVNLLTSRWSKNGTITMEWSGLKDPESGLNNTFAVFFDVDDGVSLQGRYNLTIGGSAGQANLTWESCGVELPTGKSLQIGILAVNGAGLWTTNFSVIPLRIVDLKITKLINGETDSSSTLKACRLATIEWESLGLSGTTVMLSLVRPDSPYEVVLSITQQPVPAQQNQFRWEPVPSDIPLGSFRISLKSMSPLDLDLVSLSESITIVAADVCMNVTSPNKASVWRAGEQYSIKWTVSGSFVSGNAKFELLEDGETKSNLGSVDISNGTFTWNIPSNLSPGTNYQIRVSSVTDKGLLFSTPFFEIGAASLESSSLELSLADYMLMIGILGGFAIALVVALVLVFLVLIVVIVVVIVIIRRCRRKHKHKHKHKHEHKHERKHTHKHERSTSYAMQPTPSMEAKSAIDSTTYRSSSNFDSRSSRSSSAFGSVTSSSLTASFLLISSQELVIEGELGKGKFGIVYKARYQGSAVAFKTLTQMAKEGIDDFNKEVGIMARLQHPRLVELIGVVNENQTIGIVMELMHKGSLDNFLWRNNDNRLRLSWNEKLVILHDIATGMAFVHSKGYIHRDLKSLNILIANNYRAKIADLGLARSMEKTSSTITSNVGTRYWMAPEISIGNGKYDEKCDVFSFGIIMNEILSEKEPYFHIAKKESIQFNVVQFGDFRPVIPTVDFVRQSLATEQERALLEKHFKSYVSLMQCCWRADTRVRPAFTTVIQRLNEMATMF